MNRPDGSNQIYCGWFAMLFSVIFVISGFKAEVSSYEPDSFTHKVALLSVGGSLFGIALFLLATGWIIRAIYFLPGKEDAILTTDKPTLTLGQQHEARG
jgi:hypothetical protein